MTVVETRLRREREKKARATGLSHGPRTTHLAHALGVPLLLTLGLGTLHRPPRARPSDWTDNSRRQPPSAPISSLSRPAFRGQSHRSGWVLAPARVCITICAVLDEENERDAHTHHPPSIQRPDRKARSKRSDSRSAQHHAHQHGARSSTSTVHGVLRAIYYPALRGGWSRRPLESCLSYAPTPLSLPMLRACLGFSVRVAHHFEKWQTQHGNIFLPSLPRRYMKNLSSGGSPEANGIVSRRTVSSASKPVGGLAPRPAKPSQRFNLALIRAPPPKIQRCKGCPGNQHLQPGQ